LVSQKLLNIAHQSFSHHSIQLATSAIPTDKFYKPSGTLLLANGDLIGRIKDKGSDYMGWWSWMKFVGKNQRLITIILAYQVCA
jgi:hypothetical protein